MDIREILREIDAEIRKLSKARKILEQCFSQAMRPRQIPAKRIPAKKKTQKAKPEETARAVSEPVVAEVQVTVVPPKRRREYSRRVKRVSQAARAIDTSVSAMPVFVPRAVDVKPSEPNTGDVVGIEAGRLEAAIRKSLLGSSAALSGN